MAILLLSSLVFDDAPPGLRRARPWVVAAGVLAGALVALEWLGVH